MQFSRRPCSIDYTSVSQPFFFVIRRHLLLKNAQRDRVITILLFFEFCIKSHLKSDVILFAYLYLLCFICSQDGTILAPLLEKRNIYWLVLIKYEYELRLFRLVLLKQNKLLCLDLYHLNDTCRIN